MAAPKIIPYDVELRSVNPVRSFDRPKAYTNDLNSVEFQFKVLDMTSTELTTATAVTLVYMRDGSFFANPPTDVSRVGNVFSYLLKENEGNHTGVAQIQLVVTVDGMELASQLFDFEIINGLETKVAQEVMIYDWTTLTRDARAYIDQFVADEMLREAEFDNNEFDRNAAFVVSQDARTFAFGTEQTNRGTAFTAEQNERTAAFNESESGRTTAETGRVTAEEGRVTAETGRTTAESNRVTAESNRVTAESGRVTAESGRVTAESGRATTFAGYNARITGMETDVNANGTNLVTNGDFSNGTTGWTSSNLTTTVAQNEATLLASSSIGTLYRNVPSTVNGKLYVSAWVKSTSNLVGINNYGGLGVKHSGSGNYERLSQVITPILTSWQIGIKDTRASGYDNVYVKNYLTIDLTAIFGAGNEPTVEQMDGIMAKFTNSWFNGTANLFRANAALNKLIAVDARTEFEAKNEIVNGDFSNGTTGWSSGSYAALSVVANEATVLAGAQWAWIGQSFNLIAGRKYYIRASVKTTSSSIELNINGSTYLANSTGAGVHEILKAIYTPGASGTMTVRVRDIRPSGWDNYYVKYVTLIDLTAAFGAGKEPTLAEMDRLMARFPNSWFDGVKPIQTIETLYQEKASKAQEAWITPTLVNAWTIYTAIATRVSYRKNELGKVELRGFVGSGTAGTVAFTLPVGYRPIQTVVIPTVSGGRVTVYANGNVEITAFTTYCSLDAVSFNLD